MEGIVYVVTGVDVYGYRFTMRYANRIHAFSINLFRGSVWFEDENGKRKLLKREGW